MSTLKLINSNIELALKSLENSSRGKTFVVLSNGYPFSFHKSKRGAESQIKKYSVSYYDEYTHEMTSASHGMTIEEVIVLDIVDFTNDKNIWFETMFSRWKINQSNSYILTTAKQLGVTKEVIDYIEYILNNSDASSFPCKEVEVVEEIKVEEETVIVENEEITVTEDVTVSESVTYKLNDEKNGVEIYFTSIPSESVREKLKGNGFRWSRYNKCWHAKQSTLTIEVAESICNGSTVDVNKTNESLLVEVNEPELIEFVNVEDFQVSEDVEKRLIDNSLFGDMRKIGYETKSLQESLELLKHRTVEVMDLSNSVFDKNKLINEFNKFCERYSRELNSYLYQKSINPGWAITGRGNLNIDRYNKKQDAISRKMISVVEMLEKQKEYLNKMESKFKFNIRARELMEIENEINSIDVNQIQFHSKKMSLEYYGYTYNGRATCTDNHFTMKMAGAYRIFNNAGKEVHSMKTKDTLKDAKLHMVYLESKLTECEGNYLNNKIS